MQEKVIEILGHLLRQFQEEEPRRMENATQWLQESGYTASEISTALSLFYKRFKPLERTQHRTGPEAKTPYRVMSPFEKGIIEQSAYSYLLQLYRLNVITVHELEYILERAVMFGSTRVTLDEIRYIAASVIFFDANKKSAYIHWKDEDIVH